VLSAPGAAVTFDTMSIPEQLASPKDSKTLELTQNGEVLPSRDANDGELETPLSSDFPVKIP
jgi:hypothetical protein